MDQELKNFNCNLEDKLFNEFILIITNQNLMEKDIIKIFDILGIYHHVLDCDKHNEIFTKYIDKKIMETNITNLAKNIKFLC